VLESEQRAFNQGLRVQRETNPAVYAAHDYLNAYIADRALSVASELDPETLRFDDLLPVALSGELGLVFDDGERARVIDPERDQQLLQDLGELSAYRYQHFVVLRR
jgi:hypothetical protein